MELNLTTYLIVLPLLFLAGFVDAIGGGGGLISVPAYILAGLPTHTAVASNKLSAIGGTSVATAKYLRAGLLDRRLAVPCVIAGAAGAYGGARLNYLVPERTLALILLVLLPFLAALVLNKKVFRDAADDAVVMNTKTYWTGIASAFLVGGYDGFYGPGAGTLWIIAFTALAGMSMRTANAYAKIINFSTGFTSLIVYLIHGSVIIPLALPGMLCSMAGSYLGSALAIRNGSRIIRPVIIGVIILLAIKLISENLSL